MSTEGSVTTEFYTPKNFNNSAIPSELTFNEFQVFSITGLLILFFIAAIANLAVFFDICKTRKQSKKIQFFILNLMLADMIVIFIMVPCEVIWHIFVQWKAGDFSCR